MGARQRERVSEASRKQAVSVTNSKNMICLTLRVGGIRDWTAPQSTYLSLLILEHINSCNYTATTD